MIAWLSSQLTSNPAPTTSKSIQVRNDYSSKNIAHRMKTQDRQISKSQHINTIANPIRTKSMVHKDTVCEVSPFLNVESKIMFQGKP